MVRGLSGIVEQGCRLRPSGGSFDDLFEGPAGELRAGDHAVDVVDVRLVMLPVMELKGSR